MTDSQSNGPTKTRLVRFGFGCGKIFLEVELRSSIGAAGFGGHAADGPGEKRESARKTSGSLGHHLSKFSLEEAGTADVGCLKKPAHCGCLENAGLVWPCVGRMFNQTNASAGDDFKKTQEGYVEQLISNFELRVLPLGKARQAAKELGGPDWPRGSSLVDGGELLEHCSETGCAPGLGR